MRIKFTQSGGFAGLIRGCEMDADALTPEATAGLDALRTASAPSPAPPRGSADLTQYELEIEDESGVTQITLHDMNIPVEAAALLEALIEAATPQRP